MQFRNPNILMAFLLLCQLILLVGTVLYSRTSIIWVFIAFSFVPCLAICSVTKNSNYALISLVLLFITQHGVSIFARASWGYDFNIDAINDFHTASVIYDQSSFTLGEAGYAGRSDYSSYPLMHIFYVLMSKISEIPLSFLALYVQPTLNAILVPIGLFLFFRDFFGLKERMLYFGILVFASGWYFSSFQSAFIRESFAFPLAIFCLWFASKVLKNPKFHYRFLTFFFFVSVMFSHHITSYLLIAVLVAISVSSSITQKNKRLNVLLMLLLVVFLAYQSFVLSGSFTTQFDYLFRGLLGIFDVFGKTSTVSVLSVYNPLVRYFAFSYYAIVGILTLVGLFQLYRKKNTMNKSSIVLATLFVLFFGLLTLLRLSVAPHAWSYTYYMSLRGTIWAFIGLSFVGVLALDVITKISSKVTWKAFVFLTLLFIILGVGKFAQYSQLLSDPSIESPVTYDRYVASIWLKDYAPHGSYLLVASYKEDYDSFEWARGMAPYAYLKEYFLDSKPLRDFHGYVPIINDFYEQFQNRSDISIIYSNGNTRIGFIK